MRWRLPTRYVRMGAPTALLHFRMTKGLLGSPHACSKLYTRRSPATWPATDGGGRASNLQAPHYTTGARTCGGRCPNLSNSPHLSPLYKFIEVTSDDSKYFYIPFFFVKQPTGLRSPQAPPQQQTVQAGKSRSARGMNTTWPAFDHIVELR